MKVTIVVVIYKQKLEHCTTYQTLKKTLFKSGTAFSDIELILYDNSPEKQDLPPFSPEGLRVSYVHDARNLGIVTAYNYAFSKAKENGSQWLLLLDHDTALTEEYINEVLHLPELPAEVAAVVPKIISEQTMISPVFSETFRPLKMERPKEGIQEQNVMAINSGALISVPFLDELGGFNRDFPLDYLDHWLFYALYEKGKKVWLLHSTLHHELSVMDYSTVSLTRYKSILESEHLFYKKFKKELYPAYRKQLAMRFIKQALLVKNKKISLYTLRKLFSM